MQRSKKLEGIVKEIEIFIQYGVQESEQLGAVEFLHRYTNDALALQVMKTFYTSLPDPHEEALGRIALIHEKDDIFLLGLSTARHSYLCLATDQKAILLGEYGVDIVEPETLSFFGYLNAKELCAKYPTFMACEEYEPVNASASSSCPICSAAVGEYHLLGCPVEVCPWCDGQFSRCGCRFEQLKVDALEEEEELEELEKILQEKGRIPYAKEQCPSYPSDTDE